MHIFDARHRIPDLTLKLTSLGRCRPIVEGFITVCVQLSDLLTLPGLTG
jgi:hypothetical protein